MHEKNCVIILVLAVPGGPRRKTCSLAKTASRMASSAARRSLKALASSSWMQCNLAATGCRATAVGVATLVGVMRMLPFWWKWL